jgi:proteic killer suppression protein
VIRSFGHRGLKRLFEKGDASKVRTDQAERLVIALADIYDAMSPGDLRLPGYRLHALKGDMKGFWSIWISANWRIIFRFEDGDALDVDLIDYH